MRLFLSLEAAERLDAQIAYLKAVGAEAAAEGLRIRVMDFLSNHVVRFPRSGRQLRDRDLWEMWIPRTRLVIWYRIGQDQIEVATVWHTSQDRLSGKP